jgi:Arc/MetJ-type ribon-helix-helix transcriptional regulator
MSDQHLGALVDESIIDALDELAGEARSSRSEIVRQALTEWLSEQSEIPDYLRRELRREQLKRKNRMRWQRIYFPKNVAEKFAETFESGTLDNDINPGAVDDIRDIYVEDAELLFEDEPERQDAAIEFVHELAEHAKEAEDVSEFDALDPEEMFERYTGVEEGRQAERETPILDRAIDLVEQGIDSRSLQQNLVDEFEIGTEKARDVYNAAVAEVDND